MWHLSKFILSQWHLLNFRSVFRHLIQVDPDTLWFTLNELHCPSSYVPPHPDLQPVKMSGMGRPRDEYSDNVLKLLKEEFDSVTETAGEPVAQWAAEWRERLSLSTDGFLRTAGSESSESIKRIWQSCRKAAGRRDCDNIRAVHSSDKHPGTNCAVSAAALLLRMERQGNSADFCVHYLLIDSIFFPASALFSIIFCTILLYFILFMVIINITSKVVLMNQPDGWWVVGWSCDPVLLPSSVRHPICCNFCLWDQKKAMVCLIQVLKKPNTFAPRYENEMFWSASVKPQHSGLF